MKKMNEIVLWSKSVYFVNFSLFYGIVKNYVGAGLHFMHCSFHFLNNAFVAEPILKQISGTIRNVCQYIYQFIGQP